MGEAKEARVIATKEEIAALMNGRVAELKRPPAELPPVGIHEVVPLQLSPIKEATCYAFVEAAEELEGVGWVLKLRRVGKPDRPRMLAADSSRGYTSDPGRAMRAEPEAVPEASQVGITAAARQRYERRFEKEQREREKLPFEDRLDAVVLAARKRRWNVRSEVRAVKKTKERGKALVALRELERRVHMFGGGERAA